MLNDLDVRNLLNFDFFLFGFYNLLLVVVAATACNKDLNILNVLLDLSLGVQV